MKIDLEELIKEAESLYNQIDKIQLDLIKSRLDESEGQKAKATDEMETVMCDAFQFLKCLINRKDNIVDLSEIWHGQAELPCKEKEIIVVNSEDECFCGWYKDESGSECCNIFEGVYAYNELLEYWDLVERWAYITDLLPKGGEAWNTTK